MTETDADVRSGLTLLQVATLRAVVDCVHPRDELGPSGTEIGIDEHILRGLSGSLSRFQVHYRVFLDHAEGRARHAHGDAFTALRSADQIALLDELTHEAGGEIETPAGVADGMSLLVEHTYEGLFADPVYGGNKGGVGWTLVGYPGPRTVVPAEHQVLDVVPPPSTASIYENPLFVLEETDAH